MYHFGQVPFLRPKMMHLMLEFLFVSLLMEPILPLIHVLPHTLATDGQGLSRLCVQRVIWTPRTLFFDSLDTQKCMSL